MVIDATLLKQYVTTELEDDYINNNIEALFDYFIQYTDNYFMNNRIVFHATALQDSSNKTITISGANFITNYLKAGSVIYIDRSYDNDGFYRIKSLTEDVITLDDDSILEDEESAIKITAIKFDKGIYKLLIDMLEFDNNVESGIKAESYARHSTTYDTISGGNIGDRLNSYRVLGW